ncbi:MAG TPA: MBL fold metallo-hydrolase [Solirubrobacteraceae bacterium]|nr:MBL fold metallo-hydrolase [Solirubrobacteraceae bacterium]
MSDAGHDVALVRADNPSPLTLSGTNTWVVGREPAWVVDPGPDLAAHVAAVREEVARRGGLGGVVLTHEHADHAEALPRHGGADAARGLGDGDRVGPLLVVATPGHTPTHLAFVTAEGAAFTGDAVLGEGSVFIAPDAGALTAYLAALRRLRAIAPTRLYPGHGPVVEDPAAKLDEYVAHRLDRERRLVAALEGGARATDALLDAAWGDVPAYLRPAAAITLAAHLDKLEEEGRLPAGVQRPSVGSTPLV